MESITKTMSRSLGYALLLAVLFAPYVGVEAAPPPPAMVFTPSPLNFGAVPLGSQSRLVVSLKNNTNALVTGTLSITGAGFTLAQFSSNFSVPANGTIKIQVQFKPPGLGPFAGSLTATTTAGVFVCPLTGSGV